MVAGCQARPHGVDGAGQGALGLACAAAKLAGGEASHAHVIVDVGPPDHHRHLHVAEHRAAQGAGRGRDHHQGSAGCVAGGGSAISNRY